ncbi:MAG: hypothetical protein ACR2IE_05110 [Candidatus Sumerlaeaceae bacterium]
MPPDGSRNFRSPAGARNFPGFRDPGSSSPLVMFRQFLRDEMKNVPLLAPKVSDLADIQQQRNVLQKERAQIADDRSLSSEQSLRKFHDLLKREDNLNNRQKSLLESFVNDAPRIQKQIAERRQQIQAKLKQLPEPLEDDGTEALTPQRTEARNLMQSARLYEFLDARMTSLQENPERVDMLQRFFKGMPNFDEPERGGGYEEARSRLQQIQLEQEKLSERMDRLDEEIRQLRQVLRNPVGTQRWRGQNRENLPAGPVGDRRTSGPKPLPEPGPPES